MESVELTFTSEALTAIALKAINRKTGARGLRSILEDVLLDPMFDLPGVQGVQEIVVNDDVIQGTAKPLYIYAEKSAEATAS
jgi:ATP-dependent Clp protease ATP-binding subunit ClpX